MGTEGGGSSDSTGMPGAMAVFLPALSLGGAERVMIELGLGLVEVGVPVDLVVGQVRHDTTAPDGMRLVNLGRNRMGSCILPLRGYLRDARPTALLTTLFHANLCAVVAWELAGRPCRLILREASPPSQIRAKSGRVWGVIGKHGLPLLYNRADGVIAVSRDIADELAGLGVRGRNVHTILNPRTSRLSIDRAPNKSVVPEHWLATSREMPLVVAAGRLETVKGFGTLLEAFRRLLIRRPARLVIFGEGTERNVLEALVLRLGLTDSVCLAGATANLAQILETADAFVLSSVREGCPNVLIDALSAGTPIVATDCSSSVDDILDAGRLGSIVPVGDESALAAALEEALTRPVDGTLLRARSEDFRMEVILPQYLSLLRGGEPPNPSNGGICGDPGDSGVGRIV